MSNKLPQPTSEVEAKIRERITALVERNPGCTITSVMSEVRREFKVGIGQIIVAMEREGIIRFRGGSNVYMVED